MQLTRNIATCKIINMVTFNVSHCLIDSGMLLETHFNLSDSLFVQVKVEWKFHLLFKGTDDTTTPLHHYTYELLFYEQFNFFSSGMRNRDNFRASFQSKRQTLSNTSIVLLLERQEEARNVT